MRIIPAPGAFETMHEYLLQWETFGDSIRSYRTAADLTQRELACRLGCTKQLVQAWEDAAQLPENETARILVKLLGLGRWAWAGLYDATSARPNASRDAAPASTAASAQPRMDDRRHQRVARAARSSKSR